MKKQIDPADNVHSLRNRLTDRLDELMKDNITRAYIYDQLIGLAATPPDRMFAALHAQMIWDDKSK